MIYAIGGPRLENFMPLHLLEVTTDEAGVAEFSGLIPNPPTSPRRTAGRPTG